MDIQLGGLKLKHPEKTGFTPIVDMINTPTSKLSFLTYKSLKGFMISLNVSDDDSEYFGLKPTRTGYSFEKTVTSFILKFAVITEDNDTLLTRYKTRSKASESKDSYYEEAKLQQYIWSESIIGGRPEICPPVANFSLFDNDNSKNLCHFFISKTSLDIETTDIFNYLLQLMTDNADYGLGVIVMPKVETSCTFGDVIYGVDGTDLNGIMINPDTKNAAFASVSAEVARLFLQIGVIHFDLHTGNALIFITPEGIISSLIIDFGRASNILTGEDDHFIKIDKKRQIKELRKRWFDNLLDRRSRSDEKKRLYMLHLLYNLARMDQEINQKIYKYANDDDYQMDWFEDYQKITDVPVEAFNILKREVTVDADITGIKRTTIQGYEKNGLILSFRDTNADSFVVQFPPLPASTSGGKKRTTKKNRKYKKFQKSRRYRKSRKVK